MTASVLRPRLYWVPTALVRVVASVVVVKLFGVGLALALGRASSLYATFYDVLPPLAWGALFTTCAVAVAGSFVRQLACREKTRALAFSALAAGALFTAALVLFTVNIGGFSTGAGMYIGATMLSAGLATEGRAPRLSPR